jgi:hypothetical protein
VKFIAVPLSAHFPHGPHGAPVYEVRQDDWEMVKLLDGRSILGGLMRTF